MNNQFKPLLLSGLVSLALGNAPAFANSSISDEAVNETTILITATRLPREVEDVAGTITYIDSEALEKQLAEDLDDIVRYQPGLSMRRVARGGNQGFSIRGMDGKRVLMLLDGVKSNDIYPAGTASYGNDNYELGDIKSVEIIRGPASALYGADALGGVVLLKSKDPSDYIVDDQSIYTRFDASTESATDLQKLGFTLAGTNDSFEYLIQVTHRNFADSEINGEGEQTPQDGESLGGLVKLVYQPNENNKFAFTFDNFTQEVKYNLTDPDASELPHLGLDDGERSRFSFSHVWEGASAIAEKIETRVFAQTGEALQNTRELRANSFSFDYAPFGNNSPTQRVTDFEFNQDVQGLTSTFFKTLQAGNVQHSLVYGISYELVETERPRNRCETDTVTQTEVCAIRSYPMAPPEFFPNKTFPDTETTRMGIFVQDEIVLGESGFTLIPGVRYDNFDMQTKETTLQDIVDLGFDIESTEESEVSTNLGLIYDLSETSALFFQYAEGFRAPSYDEANQAFVNLGHGYAIVPNPDLEPETSQGYEIGFKARMGNSFISAAIYENKFEDFIASSFIGQQNGINLFQDANIGEVRIYGAEFSGHWKLSDGWHLRNSIAYSVGRDETNDTPLNQVDPTSAILGAGYTSDSWGIELITTVVGSKDKVADEDDVTADSYTLFDITGYWDISNASRLRYGIFNLTDQTYARWANIQGLNADSSSIANLQEPGTEFRLGLTWKF